ncbi:hypothetical protein H271_11100 [Vibrio parahaemolyticus 1911C]|nr:hypothetical protein H271_11100 [Vibrio parahaemolyticus 1911C]
MPPQTTLIIKTNAQQKCQALRITLKQIVM